MEYVYLAAKHAHSGIRWAVLILLVLAIVNALGKRSGGTVYPAKNKLALFALISVHVQLLLGLALYLFLSPKVSFEPGAMSNVVTRFFTSVHIFGMVIGIILVTIGYSRAKRQAGINKGWKTIAIFYTLGLLVILASIPWPFQQYGAGWF